MPRNDFSISGLKELMADLAVFGKEAADEIKPYVKQAGDILLVKTRLKLMPYHKYSEEGTLIKSLFVKVGAGVRTNKYWVVLTWGDDCREYGAPLELGHNLIRDKKKNKKGQVIGKSGTVYGHVVAHPFLRPAADESKEVVFKTIINGMDNALEKLGQKDTVA